MNEENKNNQFNNKGITIYEVIIFVLFVGLLIFLFFPRLNFDRFPSNNVVCLSNLKQIGLAFQLYATNNSNSYPIPDNWCDSIRPYLGRNNDDKVFQCRAAIVKALKDNDKDKEKNKCHYAMNPNCEPNSPPDTILLFETQGGWNLSGGMELATTENHTSHTCNVLFNDGSTRRMRENEIQNLNWNNEEEEKE